MHLTKAISHDHACFFCHACFQALMRYLGATVLIVSSYYTCLSGQTSSICACHARHHFQGLLHTWSDTLPASTPVAPAPRPWSPCHPKKIINHNINPPQSHCPAVGSFCLSPFPPPNGLSFLSGCPMARVFWNLYCYCFVKVLNYLVTKILPCNRHMMNNVSRRTQGGCV